MTHDELLASLTLPLDGSYYEHTQFKRTNALRAVVERHHPFEFHLGDIISEIQCAECNKKYPCKTIIDIKKELK